MNETQITVHGFVGGTVSLKKAGETEVATFRLGCTPRYFNRRTEQWVDAPTQWYTVNAWRAMARNVAHSLGKGDAVTVVGRLTVSTWTTQDGAERTALEIEATTVGHDLRLGTAGFVRSQKPQRESHGESQGESQGDSQGASHGEEVAVEQPQPDPVGDWRTESPAA